MDAANGPDVAVSTDNDEVTILRNDGSGALGSPTTTTFAGGSHTKWLALGRVNAGGNADLAVVIDNNTIRVKLSAGDGTFTQADPLDNKNGPRGVAIGDVDGDGRADVVSANGATTGGAKSVTVFPGNGDGTFGAKSQRGENGGQYGVALGDLDGDGIDDIVSTSTSTVTVVLSGGSATGIEYSAPTVSTTPWPVLTDVTQDGALDIVVGGYPKVLVNDGDGGFAEGAQNQFDISEVDVMFATHGDFNGDGEIDIEVVENRAGQLGGTPDDLTMFNGAGDGTFTVGATAQLDDSAAIALGANLEPSGDPADDLVVLNTDPGKVTVLLARPTVAVTDVGDLPRRNWDRSRLRQHPVLQHGPVRRQGPPGPARVHRWSRRHAWRRGRRLPREDEARRVPAADRPRWLPPQVEAGRLPNAFQARRVRGPFARPRELAGEGVTGVVSPAQRAGWLPAAVTAWFLPRPGQLVRTRDPRGRRPARQDGSRQLPGQDEAGRLPHR